VDTTTPKVTPERIYNYFGYSGDSENDELLICYAQDEVMESDTKERDDSLVRGSLLIECHLIKDRSVSLNVVSTLYMDVPVVWLIVRQNVITACGSPMQTLSIYLVRLMWPQRLQLLLALHITNTLQYIIQDFTADDTIRFV